MKKLIDEIYKLKYSEISTFVGLLENIKRDNYSEINFKKIDNCIIVDLLFTVETEVVKSVYTFDKEYFLQNISITDSNGTFVAFDRDKELIDATQKYFSINEINEIAI